MGFDRDYAIACTIIQAFEPDYPSPNVEQLVTALKLASEVSGELETDKVIEWAKEYAEAWYKKTFKND